MKIVNVMISKKLGGIEQAFLDYTVGLLLKKHQVMLVADEKNKLNAQMDNLPIAEKLLINFTHYNYFLVPVLYFKLKKFAPDVIIVHNKKAVPIFKMVARLLKAKIIGVSHNPKFKKIGACDAIFTITNYQKNIFSAHFDKEKIFVIPNMITQKIAYSERKGFQNPPKICTMGRFDPMKGFPDFIRALAILKKQKVPFKAVIGGEKQKEYPAEFETMQKIIAENNLQNDVDFCGWVKDKDAFFAGADVFVLPSVYEPFGIVVLEALLHSVPLVSSLAEGPAEIFANHAECAKTFEVGNYEQMAERLKEVLSDFDKAKSMARKGYMLCQKEYMVESVADKLDGALKKVITAEC